MDTLQRAYSDSSDCEILHSVSGNVGNAVLNRPKALNALTTGMVEALYDVYSRWATAPDVACIVLQGSGEKAFCAGGDVKTVVNLGKSGNLHEALRFFKSEYKLNYLLATLPKPHIALIDGITFGGGVGVSIHGAFRVATDKTLFAMPECAIGFVPDIGGSYFLPRLPGNLGLYLGMTGARLKGVDLLHSKIATHYIPSSALPSLHQALLALPPPSNGSSMLSAVQGVLDHYQGQNPLPAGELDPGRLIDINEIFGGARSVEEVYERCESLGTQWGKETIELMAKGSPTSQRLTFELYHRGKSMSLADCLKMEFTVATNIVKDTSSDFYSGVTATLITRQGSPEWSPSTLDGVKDVSALFVSGSGAEELDLAQSVQALRELPLDEVAFYSYSSGRLLRQTYEPTNQSDSPGPAPESNDYRYCCCRGFRGRIPYKEDPPYGCCCGDDGSCCTQSTFISNMCNGSSGCVVSIIGLVTAMLIGLTLCLAGRYVSKRRARNPQPPASNNEPALCEDLVALTPEDIERLSVKTGVVPEGERECPICFECPKDWATFPCNAAHGCCGTCFDDLIKHSKKKSEKVHGVTCPLCRTMAVVPITEETLALKAKPAATHPGSRAALQRPLEDSAEIILAPTPR